MAKPTEHKQLKVILGECADCGEFTACAFCANCEDEPPLQCQSCAYHMGLDWGTRACKKHREDYPVKAVFEGKGCPECEKGVRSLEEVQAEVKGKGLPN